MEWIDIGIDLAATRLAAVVTSTGASGFVIERRTMPTDRADRAAAADTWIYRIVREYTRTPDRYQVAVYAEDPAFGRGGPGGTMPIAMIQGAIFAGAKRAGATIVIGVNNSTWKKRIVGAGNATKGDVALHVKKTWPKLYVQAKANQDVCDAACINLHGRKVREMKLRVAANKARREAKRDLSSVPSHRTRRQAA